MKKKEKVRKNLKLVYSFFQAINASMMLSWYYMMLDHNNNNNNNNNIDSESDNNDNDNDEDDNKDKDDHDES